MDISLKDVRPNEEKLKELIIYVADRCTDDPRFGAVKLNKLLYLIDVFAYAHYGEPVTGVEYMKQENGPVPRRLVPIREAMLADRSIVEVERPSSMSNPRRRVVACRPADLSVFSPREIAHIDKIIQDVWDYSGTNLSDITHAWRGWRIARKLGDTIPYDAVFLSDEPPTDYEVAHAEELISEHSWDVR